MTKTEYLDRIFSTITDVPTLPATVLQVMHSVEDPSCSVADLSRTIMGDPGLAAKVLKIANSPYYGFAAKIGSLPQAVSLLGFATLKNALLSASVFDMFRISGIGFDMVGLWKHSVTTATAAKIVARRIHYPNAEKAFTASLLHDIGKVMIARYLPSSLATVVQSVRNDHLAIYDAEKRAIGLAHPAFGAWVLARWSMPALLVEAVEHHHHPTRAQDAFDLSSVIYLSNAIAHRSKIGSGGDDLVREVDPHILQYFHIDETAMREMTDAVLRQRLEIETFAANVASA